jgi:hypothetical protein
MEMMGGSQTEAARTMRVKEVVAKYGTNLVSKLIAYLHDVHYGSELRGVREVLKETGPDTAPALIAAITGEASPAQKSKLIQCLEDFSGPAVTAALRTQLDDDRPPENEPPPVYKVAPAACSPRDAAYYAINKKVGGKNAHKDNFEFLKGSQEQRTVMIEALKAQLDSLPDN